MKALIEFIISEPLTSQFDNILSMSFKLIEVDWNRDWLNIGRMLNDSSASPYNSFMRHVISEQNNRLSTNERWRDAIAELVDKKDQALYAVKVVDTRSEELAGAAIFNIHSSQQPVEKAGQCLFSIKAGDFPQVCKDHAHSQLQGMITESVQ